MYVREYFLSSYVYDDVTYVYDDMTYVYDDVTYVYDDVTYVHLEAARRRVRNGAFCHEVYYCVQV